MNKKLRILSFMLALVLAFGCMTTTLFAVAQTEVPGGVITEEDIENGATDAITGTKHPNAGIKTAAEIAALIGSDKIAFEFGDNDYANSDIALNHVNGVSQSHSAGGFYSVKSEGEEQYLVIGEASDVTFEHGKKSEIYINNTNNYASGDNFVGEDFVVGIDLRLAKKVSDSWSMNFLRLSMGASVNRFPLSIKGDGSIVIEKGYMSTGVAYTIEEAVNSGADVAFSNVSIHVHPSTNSFDVYIDGICKTSGIKTVLFSNDNIKAIATAAGVDASLTAAELYEIVKANVVFKDARFFPNGNIYHGAKCPDTCTETHTDATKVPFMFTGEQIHVDTIKAYYSDLFLECSGSSENITVAEGHTHNEANATASASVVCNNCKAKWNVVIPMDQTGNSLCDLCEIANKNQDVSEFHDTATVKELVNVAPDYFTIKDGSTSVSSRVTMNTDANGNAYYTFGTAVTTDTYDTTYAGVQVGKSDTQALIKNGDTTKRGQSFVLQVDIKLGENFYNQAKAMGLFRIRSYSNLNFQRDDQYLAQIKADGKLYVNKDGGRYTSNYEICELSTETYTTIALHVKTGSSTNQYGSYDVYINGKLEETNIPLFTKAVFEEYFGTNGSSYTIDGETVACQGIKDYVLSEVHICRMASALSYDNVYYADNLMAYYSETYDGAFTRHEYETHSHTHDYSKNCIEYGTTCKYCSAGQGGYAVLDANGDKICDYCANKALGFTGNGVTNPSDLAEKLGDKGTVELANAIVKTGYYGFDYIKTSTAALEVVTDEATGNLYLKLTGANGNTQAPANKDVVTDIKVAQQNIKDNPNGLSFVVSADVRLGANYTGSATVFELWPMSNVRDKSETDTTPTSSNNIARSYIISINSEGYLCYRDEKRGASVTTTYKIGTENFTTIAMHVRPGDGEYGLYDIYIDGNLAVAGIQFMNASQSASIAWEYRDLTDSAAENPTGTVKSEGVKNYTLRKVYYFNKSGLTTAEADYLHLDNAKLYYSDEYIEHAEHHDYTATAHTHNLDNKTIEVTFECACGHKDVIELPIDTTLDGACDTCGKYILDGGVFVTAKQAILGDMISMKIYAQVSAETAKNPNAYAVLTAGDRTERYSISEMQANNDGLYEFVIQLRSIDLTAPVTMAIEIDGTLGEQTYTTTVRDYTEALIKTTEQAYVKDICIAMLNYGAAAQTYFAVKNGDAAIAATLANAGLTPEQKALVDKVDAGALSDYAMSISGSADDITFNAATLVLDSTISVKLYFTAPEGAGVTLNGNAVTPVKSGNEYYVRIDGLLPQDLDTVQTLSVTTDAGTKTLYFSTLSTVRQLLLSNASDEFKNLGRALYLYSLAADIYKAYDNAEPAQTAAAEVVVKDGAKGAVAIVYDDGNVNAANFIKGYLNEYTSTDVSFALRTSNYATLSKEADGTYSYTQTAAQEEKVAYWTDYQNTYGDRIEYLNHSYTHKEGDDYEEILGSQHIIQNLFGYEGQTFVIPGFDSGTKTEEYDALAAATNLVCRGTANTTNAANMVSTLETFRTKRAELPAFMASYKTTWLTEAGTFNTDKDVAIQGNAGEGKVDISFIKAFINSAMETGSLAAFCFHYIVEDGGTTGYSSMDNLMMYDSQAKAIFAYVDGLAASGALWSATFGEVCEYYCEWSTSELDVREISEGIFAINLTDDEDDAVCDTRLTVKVSVSDDVTGATLTQGAYTETAEVKGEAGAKYVLVNVLPDGGIATLKTAN